MLPKKKDGLPALCSHLSLAQIEHWTNSVQEHHGQLFLPRFHIESKNDLIPALTALGMGALFSNTADFSKMFQISRGVTIGRFNQVLSLDLNENGTEAAALTEVEYYMGVSFEVPFEMRCDHPFLFVLKDEQTGAIEFIGTVADPIDAGLSGADLEKGLIDTFNKACSDPALKTDFKRGPRPAGTHLIGFYIQRNEYAKAAGVMERMLAADGYSGSDLTSLESLAQLQVMADNLPAADRTFDRICAALENERAHYPGADVKWLNEAMAIKRLLGKPIEKQLALKEKLLRYEVKNAIETERKNYSFVDQEELNLGEFLLEQKRYKEAEPLLLDARERFAVKEHQSLKKDGSPLERSTDKLDERYMRTLKALSQLYKATGRGADSVKLQPEIARVKQRLDQLEAEVRSFNAKYAKGLPNAAASGSHAQFSKVYQQIFGDEQFQ